MMKQHWITLFIRASILPVVAVLFTSSARGDLVIGGTARFTFDEAVSGASTPINTLQAVFVGTQSRAETLSGVGDPLDSVNGSLKTITFQINGETPAAITGRPNNAQTTLNYNPSDVLGSWTAGTDFGAFLGGGEQIGLQSMTRWGGDFTGSLLFGDFAIRHAPGRANGVLSGLVLTSNIDFADATYADLANVTLTASSSSLKITGDLLYSSGFALLTNDPTDVGVRFGSFEVNAFTAVPEPSAAVLLVTIGALSIRRRRDKRSKGS
jgi:hypothetical protein